MHQVRQHEDTRSLCHPPPARGCASRPRSEAAPSSRRTMPQDSRFRNSAMPSTHTVARPRRSSIVLSASLRASLAHVSSGLPSAASLIPVVRLLGCPALLLTFSAADLRWEDLQRRMLRRYVISAIARWSLRYFEYRLRHSAVAAFTVQMARQSNAADCTLSISTTNAQCSR